MTDDEIVMVLRCAADLCETGFALWDSAIAATCYLLGFESPAPVVVNCWAVGVRPVDRLNRFDKRDALLEAAARIEEKWRP